MPTLTLRGWVWLTIIVGSLLFWAGIVRMVAVNAAPLRDRAAMPIEMPPAALQRETIANVLFTPQVQAECEKLGSRTGVSGCGREDLRTVVLPEPCSYRGAYARLTCKAVDELAAAAGVKVQISYVEDVAAACAVWAAPADKGYCVTPMRLIVLPLSNRFRGDFADLTTHELAHLHGWRHPADWMIAAR